MNTTFLSLTFRWTLPKLLKDFSTSHRSVSVDILYLRHLFFWSFLFFLKNWCWGNLWRGLSFALFFSFHKLYNLIWRLYKFDLELSKLIRSLGDCFQLSIEILDKGKDGFKIFSINAGLSFSIKLNNKLVPLFRYLFNVGSYFSEEGD